MRAIATGGAGFIGSNLVDALLKDGADVLVIDDLSTGRLANLDCSMRFGCRLNELDVRDGAGVEQAFRDFEPEVVFHLAAQMDVRESMAYPARDASINVLGSINVFAAAHKVGVRRVVNTSTGGAIYGDGAEVPTPETAPTHPASAYGLSKRTVEHYASWFRRTHGLDLVTLRYGNVYGPRQDPHGDAGVIALFCGRALSGGRPTVYGDGQQTRDYVFVGDIVAANLAAARAAALSHTEYNVGTGKEISVLELVSAVANAAGVDPADFAPEFGPTRAGELVRSCLDTSRARRELHTEPLTTLTTGLDCTIDWMRELTGSGAAGVATRAKPSTPAGLDR